jgi:hypothetical protein
VGGDDEDVLPSVASGILVGRRRGVGAEREAPLGAVPGAEANLDRRRLESEVGQLHRRSPGDDALEPHGEF